jgi:hypothetical protein
MRRKKKEDDDDDGPEGGIWDACSSSKRRLADTETVFVVYKTDEKE